MKSRFLKIACVAMLLIFVYATISNALSFVATITPSSPTVPESTEFTVVVKISNLDVGSNGINSLSGYLKYDDDVFETINDSSIDGLNSWNPSYNSENSKKITLTKTTFVKSEEQVFQVTFKTKSGTSGKTGKIQLTNIVASNSESEISAADITTKITVGNVTTETGNTTGGDGTQTGIGGNGGSTTGPGSGSSSTNSTGNLSIIGGSGSGSGNTSGNSASGSNSISLVSNSSSSVKNGVNSSVVNGVVSYINATNSSSESDMPYTGTEDTVKVLIAVCLAVAIGFYIKFEKVNKEIK